MVILLNLSHRKMILYHRSRLMWPLQTAKLFMQQIVLTVHFICSNINNCPQPPEGGFTNCNMRYTRKKFITKLIQVGLLGILLLITFLLGSKVVSGKDCKGCPGNGICRGETDCSKY
jgi:hypothetical protein